MEWSLNTHNKSHGLNKSSIFLSFAAGYILILNACNSTTVTPRDFTFYYYPQRNVYFDPASHRYYYSLNGAASWDSMYSKSENPLALGPRIILSDPSKNIWTKNNEHRSQYNGTLINIPPGDTTLIAASSTIRERRTILRAIIPEKKPEKKDKRNFFQRLFGKKKK